MLRPIRALLPLIASLVAVPAPASAQVPAPASAQVPAGVVAEVRRPDGTVFAAIGEAQYGRFFNAALAQTQGRPIAKAVPLVAPDFNACVSSKRSIDSGPRPRTRRGRLRVCRRTYEETRNTAVQQLLNLNWIAAESALRGIVITDRRLARERRDIIRNQFGGTKAYQRFLRESTLTEDDVRLNILAQLGQVALVRQIQASVDFIEDPQERMDAEQTSLNEFRTDFLLRWQAATSCAPAFAALPACTGESAADAPESGSEQPELRWGIARSAASHVAQL